MCLYRCAGRWGVYIVMRCGDVRVVVLVGFCVWFLGGELRVLLWLVSGRVGVCVLFLFVFLRLWGGLFGVLLRVGRYSMSA